MTLHYYSINNCIWTSMMIITLMSLTFLYRKCINIWPTMSTEPASMESLRVLYQSDDYIVVDKHWDIRIDSKMWYEKVTVQAQLRQHFPELADPKTYYGFRWTYWALSKYQQSHKTGLLLQWVCNLYSLFVILSDSVINWISPPVGLSVWPLIKLQLARPTAASRTELSPKSTWLWYRPHIHKTFEGLL